MIQLSGKVIWDTVGSLVLKGNPLGDPRTRELAVYLPPSYPEELDRRYPVVFYLPGFAGTPRGTTPSHPWKESLVERLDRMIVSRRAAECVLVVPDCFTKYGGSQYRNSEATGRYEDHIISELIGYIDGKYRTLSGPGQRAIMGKSSGGYGALWLGMRHPDIFGHLVCHSGDMSFEACYGVDFPKCVNALGKFGGSFRKFLKEFSSARDKNSFPHELVNIAGMASSYSPNKKSPMGFDIPFDETTGEILPRVWKRWQACDPVHLAKKHAGNLKKLKTLYFDCGRKDEFYLHLGARRLSRELKRLGVSHVYEEHELGHFDMGVRYDQSFERLGKAFRKAHG